MKEDILEQIVEGWLLSEKSTFTKHNVKFRPHKETTYPDKSLTYNGKSDSVHSDIDILAVHMDKESSERVSVVSCKSWQNGFDIKFYLDNLIGNKNKIVSGREIWKSLRELADDKWADSFRKKIIEETGSRDFTYYIAVTKIKNNIFQDDFERNESFLNRLSGNGEGKIKIKIIDLKKIWIDVWGKLESKTVESTEIGRMIQLIKASELSIT